jgi:integrase/recombinase XerC
MPTVPDRSFPKARSLHNAPWPVVLDAFLAAGVDSENTRKAYRRNITAAFTTMRVRSLQGVTGLTLARYRAGLVADGRSPAAHAQVLASLRSFLRWAGLFGAHRVRQEVVAAALKIPRVTVRRPYQVLSPAEEKALVAAAASTRDRAILAVLLGSGLRAAEVSALDVGDILRTPDGPALYVHSGKGRRDRTVPVAGTIDRTIRRYVAETEDLRGQGGPLFLADDNGTASRGHHRLSARSIAIMLSHAADRAGIIGKSVSPHALRHTFASRSFRKSRDLVAVSRLLGHAGVATTERYCAAE